MSKSPWPTFLTAHFNAYDLQKLLKIPKFRAEQLLSDYSSRISIKELKRMQPNFQQRPSLPRLLPLRKTNFERRDQPDHNLPPNLDYFKAVVVDTDHHQVRLHYQSRERQFFPFSRPLKLEVILREIFDYAMLHKEKKKSTIFSKFADLEKEELREVYKDSKADFVKLKFVFDDDFDAFLNLGRHERLDIKKVFGKYPLRYLSPFTNLTLTDVNPYDYVRHEGTEPELLEMLTAIDYAFVEDIGPDGYVKYLTRCRELIALRTPEAVYFAYYKERHPIDRPILLNPTARRDALTPVFLDDVIPVSIPNREECVILSPTGHHITIHRTIAEVEASIKEPLYNKKSIHYQPWMPWISSMGRVQYVNK